MSFSNRSKPAESRAILSSILWLYWLWGADTKGGSRSPGRKYLEVRILRPENVLRMSGDVMPSMAPSWALCRQRESCGWPIATGCHVSCNVVPRLPLLLGVPDDGVAAGSEDKGKIHHTMCTCIYHMQAVSSRQTQRKLAKLATLFGTRNTWNNSMAWPGMMWAWLLSLLFLSPSPSWNPLAQWCCRGC